MSPPEHDPERDAVLQALLAHVPFEGWTGPALRRALVDLGLPAEDAALFFPGGAAEMIEAYADLADRRMAAEAHNFAEQRLSGRIESLIMKRFEQNRPHKEAVRRAVAHLALPQNSMLALQLTLRTSDAIWTAAKDVATDFSWYTKRAMLAAIYDAALLFWLRDVSEDDLETRAFVHRSLQAIGRFGRWRSEVQSRMPKLGSRFPGTR